MLVLILVALVVVPGPGRARAATGDPRPNILFVLTDDMTRADLHSMPGVRRAITDHGLQFTHAMVSVSLCCPSRTTILRGQYAHNTKVLTNGGSNGGFETAYRYGDERSTLATWLRRRGYDTALIGKYLNGFPNTAGLHYVPPGWTDFVSPVAGQPYTQFDYTLSVNGHLERHGHRPADYGTDVYLRHAERFIDTAHRAGRPFFLDLSVYAPHRPAIPAPRDAHTLDGLALPRTPAFDPPRSPTEPRWLQRIPPLTPREIARTTALFERRRESLRAVDRAVVALVDRLRALHELDRTYVVFTSDNGFHQGQYRLPAGKQTAFDTDLRVPLVARGPEVPVRRTTGALVGNVDLAPTFAQLAGATAPRFVDGRSFAGVLTGRVRPYPRKGFLIEHWPEQGVTPRGPRLPLEPEDRDQQDTPLQPSRSGPDHRRHHRHHRDGQGIIDPDTIPEYHGLRTATYTYVEYPDGERELYDLRRDPFELHNVYGRVTRETQIHLAQELAPLLDCRASECRDADERPTVTIRYQGRPPRTPRPAARSAR